jgi:archaemetzincin
VTRAVPLLILCAAVSCRPAAETAVPPQPEAGFERLPPPKPGDWLASFREDGQTYDQYVDSCANRRSGTRHTIYLQPYGAPDERYGAALEAMREYAGLFFGVRAVVLEPVPLPDDCLVRPRNQYNATMLIERLEARLPDDALALAGIANRDLFSRGLRFVFGEGSLTSRCGVYSLARFEHDPDRFLRRSLQLLTHELGHVLGIGHCTLWKCVMCGSNSLEESDRHPLHLCPEDLRKVVWNTGVDARGRYGRLAAFYERSGLPDDARWCRERAGS